MEETQTVQELDFSNLPLFFFKGVFLWDFVIHAADQL